jgi:hypothetical protein
MVEVPWTHAGSYAIYRAHFHRTASRSKNEQPHSKATENQEMSEFSCF